MATALDDIPKAVLLDLLAEMGEPPGFASDAHREFWESREPEVVASGWMGAGKSRILCQKAWWAAMRYPGVTVGLFRKAHASIASTTERTFERDVVDHRYILPGHQGRNKTEHWWGLTNGSRIYFLGLDPDPVTGVPSKVGSLDLGWAGVDEAVELTEGDWIMLLGRLRDPRMPWHQLCAATNPAQPTHWLRQRMLSSGHIIHIKDNRFMSEWYRNMLANLPDNAIGRRLGRGEWAAVEGAIWQIEQSMVKDLDQPFKRTVAGLDWGFVHAFAIEVVGQTGSGRLAVVDELYQKGRGLDQLVPEIADLFERRQVEAAYYDPSEPGLASTLTRGLEEHRRYHEGCTLKVRLEAANNDVSLGLQAVDKQLRGAMPISPRCQGLINEIPSYTWQPQKGGGFKEQPVNINDDACDALRYAVMALEPDPKNPWAALTNAGGVA